MANGGKRPGAGRKGGGENEKHRKLKQGLERYVAQAIKNVVARMRSENERISLDASIYIIDQVHGKPRQKAEPTGANGQSIIESIRITVVNQSGTQPQSDAHL